MPAVIRASVLASLLASLAAPAAAQETGGWYALDVPNGRSTLRSLGVADTRERSAVMVELIRRFLFATTSQANLEAALRKIPATAADKVTLPLPLSPAKWSSLVFERTVPPARLFAEILLNPSARLLFHGLAGLDQPTRSWFEGQDDVIRRVYRDPDALKSFALFAPSLQIADGRLVLAGGATAEQRWFDIIDATPDQPAKFISRMFADRNGRTAGLFATIAFSEEARRKFLLGPSPARFSELVSGFARCYPEHTSDYPFALRSHDAALLLLDVELTRDGRVAGPSSQRFWQQVLDSNDLAGQPLNDLSGGEAIDAAWLVKRLCDASATDRGAVFATMLAGPRVFGDLPDRERTDAVIALRVRRLFAAVFMGMERAGVGKAATVAAVGRHASRLGRLNDMDGASIALRQFQGALALTLNAAAAHTVSLDEADRLLVSLAAVPFDRERYDGGIAGWLGREWLPAMRRALRLGPELTAEQVVTLALAGPSPSQPKPIRWEDVDYIVDFPAEARQRLREVRERQGGNTLDAALASKQDAQLAQVLASWAYAPHVGAADGGALVGGDSSLRHDIGVRSVNRTRFEQRWEISPTAGERGVTAGSYLGVIAPLANWSLRRLASDRIPPPPTIGDNDLSSLFLTAALSDPNTLLDGDMSRIATAIENGSRIVAQAASDIDRLSDAARVAAISPWRRAVLPWMVAQEPERVAEQFTLTHRARLGGLKSRDVDAWGTASLATGCLCLRMPPPRIPELIAGRPADGIVGAESADLMLRIAVLLSEMRLPAALAAPVLSYAMRDFLDAVRPSHPADFDAFSRQAPMVDRTTVEDYISAIAAVGALRPTSAKATVGKPVPQ
jgi:hypothetical protein